MNYFKALGIIFGVVALLKPVYIHLIPYDEFSLIGKAYQQQRPRWVVFAGIVGVILVAFTWYMYFITDIKYSIVIAILFSVTLIKAIALLFNYQAFQKWVAGLLVKEKNSRIVAIDIAVSVFGLGMVVVSVLLL